MPRFGHDPAKAPIATHIREECLVSGEAWGAASTKGRRPAKTLNPLCERVQFAREQRERQRVANAPNREGRRERCAERHCLGVCKMKIMRVIGVGIDTREPRGMLSVGRDTRSISTNSGSGRHSGVTPEMLDEVGSSSFNGRDL